VLTDPPRSLWVGARRQCRQRWLATIAPAAAALVLATVLRHDSAGLLIAISLAAAGSLLAVGQLVMLMGRYGGLVPSAAHLGEPVEIAVTPPRVRDVLVPVATAAVVAAMFLVTAEGKPAADRNAFAVILFGSVCSLWIGFDAVAAILTSRWERASGLVIYCPQPRLFRHAHAVHVGVNRQPADGGRRQTRPMLFAICSIAVMLLVAGDMYTLIGRVAPWDRNLPTLASETYVSHIDPKLSAAASTLVGHSVEVRCWSTRDWANILRVHGRPDAAFTNMQTSRIQLSPAVCRPLMALRYRAVEPPGTSSAAFSLSFAVEVLGHEAGHLVNSPNESTAECFGLRSVQRTAMLTGADADYGVWLETIYRYRIYPQRAAIYRVGGCPPT
jgi:hypothetical protein